MPLPKYEFLIDEEKRDAGRPSSESSGSGSETLRSLNFPLRSSKYSCSKMVGIFIWILGIASLAVLILYTLVWPEQGDFFPECKWHESTSIKAISSDIAKVGTTAVTFEADKLFSASPSPESDAAWDSLLPSKRIIICEWGIIC